MTDDEIIAIRDEHLPSQGESFDCIAFARAVIARERNECAADVVIAAEESACIAAMMERSGYCAYARSFIFPADEIVHRRLLALAKQLRAAAERMRQT